MFPNQAEMCLNSISHRKDKRVLFTVTVNIVQCSFDLLMVVAVREKTLWQLMA